MQLIVHDYFYEDLIFFLKFLTSKKQLLEVKKLEGKKEKGLHMKILMD